MNNLSQINLDRIISFFNEIELNHLNLVDYIYTDDLQNLDFSNAFDEIIDLLNEGNAFDIDIIYYSNSMEYLTLHDTSLKDSIDLAINMGYELKDINSEILASLLATEITQNAFYEYQDKINEFFENFDAVEFGK